MNELKVTLTRHILLNYMTSGTYSLLQNYNCDWTIYLSKGCDTGPTNWQVNFDFELFYSLSLSDEYFIIILGRIDEGFSLSWGFSLACAIVLCSLVLALLNNFHLCCFLCYCHYVSANGNGIGR